MPLNYEQRVRHIAGNDLIYTMPINFSNPWPRPAPLSQNKGFQMWLKPEYNPDYERKNGDLNAALERATRLARETCVDDRLKKVLTTLEISARWVYKGIFAYAGFIIVKAFIVGIMQINW